MAPAGRLFAVDWGDKRIGLAISDELGMLASPVGIITRRAGKRPPIAELMRHADALGATGYVVGLPLDPAGAETDRTREVRDVAAKLAARQSLPVRLVDERFTTSAALRSIKDQGGSTRGRKGDVDALAACVLLESVLRAASQGVELGEPVVAAVE
ncbi:Holliday junction resolvase RuvX [Gemmatimonas sp.]|jgi:putative Holliday junction resolvase|uniref:Holliday junction resolvase RuvX n=1 Tax=Gemmatimonas sp. TaxID=1962908 RepID=UPI0022C30CE8|nr:Holliday junction resolvase RuvX [Gemmatimonas sp.]MCA2989015.1 Holliday junction resolvase RuvX [Gemmatimonas sp.]MCA2989431.1 Holliday junction resolvase RuvX [Gemmatimonas sp.]MCE2952893.1 Holliday junction resolvase RuvX [Gemmatimonas sp.]MCZ8011854.1 Holliday junction resolvase RuvX [Gemmatimonas sp.]MCZ8265597.1 Holliday junction resolvase RuvX [Gemmatimonas sp.]